jgi:organic radical activating enzyme
MKNNFCSYPFEHLYLHSTGHFKVCCMMDEHVTKNDGYRQFNASRDSLTALWNSGYYKQIRKDMLANKRLEKCNKCWLAEDNGLSSMRRKLDPQHYEKYTRSDGTLDLQPTDIELHFGNVCNLSCKMCSTQFSHMIGKELIKMGEHDPDFLKWVKKESGLVNNWTSELDVVYDWYKNEKIKKEIFEVVSKHSEKLVVIGGEPTIIPEFYELLEYCYDQKTLKNKSLTVTTNLTNTNPKFTKWLNELKDFTIHASVDGIGERNEYIRYPSKWTSIQKSLDFYASMMKDQKKGHISFNPAIQTLNIDILPEMVQYFETFDDIAEYSWISHVRWPIICDYDHAPIGWKNKVADKIDSQLVMVKNELNRKELEQHSSRLRVESDSKFLRHIQSSFIRYNDAQDSFRKCKSWRELMPDLATSLTELNL